MKKRVPKLLNGLLKNEEESRYGKMVYMAIFALSILVLRLFYMQMIDGSYYRQEAEGNRVRTLPLLASRGAMYDRNGILLVGSRSSYSVIIPVDRKKESLPEEELQKLSVLL